MPLWKMLILSVVQGIGEFLPISSSGHVVVVASLLNESTEELDIADVNIVLHLGTLLSILVYYRQRVLNLLSTDRRLIPLLIVATIPAVIVGLPLKMLAGEVLESPLVAGLMFPVTGAVLLLALRLKPGTIDYRNMSVLQAWWVGCAQAAAILPGLSRSGSTISAGMGQGLKRESAATFSFLMAIPAIAGAGVLELISILKKGNYQPGAPLDVMLIGAAVSFVIGLAAIWILVRLLEKGYVKVFAWYCIALGIVVTAWQLSKLVS